ncbi:efflux RND transporter periplasmic adaptor subunit [Yoonia sp. F2084L]|uniref:efflux RND transporter periplasmic adaptor subunit n=1 Tax=Yoonia sp. F2084L TaxID=2926419 RepID=UPI001FF5F7A5|nr:efflux RND transporter periplasmic adaptor subunit [Yoonia sp. F2084L]MCK0095059.1 efflux RND transporter periplasmic adaptor subunit [Yoonia sp. F2084L]
MSPNNQPDLAGKLKFDDDNGAGRSKWIAGVLALILFGWMGSGYILPSQAAEDDVAQEPAPRAVVVAVMPSQAADVQLVLSAEGQSEPDRATMIKAEAGGQVSSVSVARGDLVTAGQELGRLDAGTFEAQLLQAETQLEQTTRDLNNAIALQERGVATDDRVSMARAANAAADAATTAAQEQLENTIIRAPFAGRLNDLTLDEGEYVDAGDIVAEVLDNDPITVVIQVPQQALSRIQNGQMAEVQFITGEERTGVVSFIGANADQQTRTFRVEVTVDNPDSVMPAGLSARIALPTGKARGHFISPAILSLDVSGELGIKTVEADNTVSFIPVSIVRAQTDGVWITGLPDDADIITVGQGFVNAGDVVDPRPMGADQTADISQ